MAQAKEKIFETTYGLLIYYSNEATDNQKKSFFNLINRNNIPYFILDPQDFSRTISNLVKDITIQPEINQQNTKIKNGKLVDNNILFFSGFTREQVEDFLETIRDEKYPRFPLKAAATEHNYDFTFGQLIEELIKDRTVISHVINLRKRINELKRLIDQSNKLKQADKLILETEISKAEKLLVDIEKTFDLTEFKKQINKFNKLLAEIKKKESE